MNDLPVEQSFSIQFDTSEEEFLHGLGILDLCEEQMAKLPQLECKTEHEFIKGSAPFYIRTIVMPAGMLITSKIHKTEHPFHISQGDVSVWTKGTGTMRFRGPCSGITRPLTKRLLFTHEETIWSTFHQGEWETVEEVESDIILPHFNPLLSTPYFNAYNEPQHYVLHND
jgi:hypothetical protein